MKKYRKIEKRTGICLCSFLSPVLCLIFPCNRVLVRVYEYFQIKPTRAHFWQRVFTLLVKQSINWNKIWLDGNLLRRVRVTMGIWLLIYSVFILITFSLNYLSKKFKIYSFIVINGISLWHSIICQVLLILHQSLKFQALAKANVIDVHQFCFARGVEN